VKHASRQPRHVLVLALLCAGGAAWAQDRLEYPAAPRGNQTDVYDGVRVGDPYRWLEDQDSAETKAWVAAENELSGNYFEQLPETKTMGEHVAKLGFTEFGVPEKVNGRYFYLENPTSVDRTIAWVTSSLDETGHGIFDFGAVTSAVGVAFSGHSISDDGQWIAFGEAFAGSDWERWMVRNVDTGEDLPDALDWVKGSVPSWTRDGKAFYYSHYDKPKAGEPAHYDHNKLYRHRLRTSQEDDVLVLKSDEHKDWAFSPVVTDDGRYLVITIARSSDERCAISYQDLDADKSAIVELFPGFDHLWDFLGNKGSALYFRTDLDAPRRRIVKIDVAKGGAPIEVVPQAEESLDSASLVGGELIATYLKDAHSAVGVFGLDGKARGEIALPGLGTIAGFGGLLTDQETFYSFTSFTTPKTIYRYDIATGASTIWKQPRIDFESDHYESKQVFVASKDGTKVPLWINARKNAKGPRPTILTGYGGFGISLTPELDAGALAWMEQGGAYAVANIRGGGEYGKPWHEAGRKAKKQNVFDDFIACAEWLEANGVTTPGKLGIKGGSNGGLLVGACLVQRPELFGGVASDAGVMDMLRFQKFSGGWNWIDEYGSSEDPEDFKALRAYSPYHNVKKARYPAVLVRAGDNDDRVVPSHSYKFVAALQAAQQGPAPILLQVTTGAGHGDHNASEKEIAGELLELSFFQHVLR
jgi:prolyl oligopeptidase